MKKTSIFLAFLLAPALFAGITFSDNSGSGVTGSSLTISITNNTTSNPLGTVCIGMHDVTTADRVISSVKWGGTNMTKACGMDDGSTKSGYVYYLVSPPSGSNRVVITTAGTVSGLGASVATWNGVNQSTPLDSTKVSSNATSTTPLVTITNSLSNSMIVDQLTKYLVTGTVTPNSPQTTIGNAAIGAAYWEANTYKLGTTNGIYSMGYTFSITSPSIIAVASFREFVAATTNSGSVLPMTGVGN